MPIYGFRNTVFSNFTAVDGGVVLDGVRYPTVEHAYQAAKTTVPHERARFLAAASPAEAKHMGRSVTIRSDWHDIRVKTMRDLLRQKFRYGSLPAAILLAIEPPFVEVNTWGDRFWGECPRGKGQNMLGKLLEEIRHDLNIADRQLNTITSTPSTRT